MKVLNAISAYQPAMVGIVAVAYLGAPIVGKALCKESRTDIKLPARVFYADKFSTCKLPDEFEIPMAIVSGSSSNSSSIMISLA